MRFQMDIDDAAETEVLRVEMNAELLQLNSYQRALRDRVERSCKFRLENGRAPTQDELGPMPVAADFPGLDAEIAANLEKYSNSRAARAAELAANRARFIKDKATQARADRKAETGLVGVYQSERGDGWRAHFRPDEIVPGFKKMERRFRSVIDACRWRNKVVSDYYGPGERDDMRCHMPTVYRIYGKNA